eukprot:3436254-Lingulodinium_polyedra.AAC.1
MPGHCPTVARTLPDHRQDIARCSDHRRHPSKCTLRGGVKTLRVRALRFECTNETAVTWART